MLLKTTKKKEYKQRMILEWLLIKSILTNKFFLERSKTFCGRILPPRKQHKHSWMVPLESRRKIDTNIIRNKKKLTRRCWSSCRREKPNQCKKKNKFWMGSTLSWRMGGTCRLMSYWNTLTCLDWSRKTQGQMKKILNS